MKSQKRNAFTLIEILIVVVIMAILAATIIPQFTDSSADAEVSTVEFNVNTLRSQIGLYKAQHGGARPAHDATLKTISGLTTATSYNGNSYGPYMAAFPENTVTGNADVKVVTSSPMTSSDVTTGDTGGWIYNTTTGEIRIDHSAHVLK